MRISTIVVNWNTRQLLSECLDSIASTCSTEEMEVWVVDNASTDGSAAMVEQSFPQVNLISSKENLGFGRANNLALPHTSGEYLLLLNPDTVVKPEAVSVLLRYLQEHSRVGAVGPRIFSTDGIVQRSVHPTPTLLREVWRLFHLDRIFPFSQYPARCFRVTSSRPVDVIMGSCMLIRRAVVDRVGLFDEQFFVYSEEVDLCERIRRAGWEIHYVPDSNIVHHGAQSTNQVADAMFVELYRNKVRFFRKYYGEARTCLYKILLWLVCLSRILPAMLACLSPHPRRAIIHSRGCRYRHLVSRLREM